MKIPESDKPNKVLSMRTLYLLATIFLLTSCATQVTSIKKDEDKLLDNDRGYVLLGVETNRDLKKILISGPEDIVLTAEDIKQGTNYLLVDLEAGTYVIEKVHLDNYWRFEMGEEEYWSFDVKSNEISYVGHFEIARRGFWSLFTNAELVNRSSEALEFLEEKYPNVLASRSMHYGGPGDDSFYEYLESLAKSKLKKDPKAKVSWEK